MENTSGNRKQSIIDAVSYRDAAKLEQLLRTTDNPVLDFHWGYFTPLGLAIMKKEYVLVEKLLHAGASANFPIDNGYTALMLASIAGSMDICNLLLKHGADVHGSHTKMAYTALYYAAQYGELKTASLLLEHGARIYDSSIPWHEQTSSIKVAIQWRKPKMLNFLLDYCNKTDMEIPLPLIFREAATRAGSDECAIIALKQGYSPESVASAKGTWFQMAADTGSVKLVSVLVELNPHFLQEDWLLQNQLPEKLTAHPDFCDWLVGYRKRPPCLQKLCRSVILSQLQVIYCIPKVRELPLPRVLKTYLTAVESAYDWS